MQTQNSNVWNSIELQSVLLDESLFQVHSGQYEGAPARITVIAPSLSDDVQFRAAFRTDMQRLEQLQHPGIGDSFIWGEHDGSIFYLSHASQQVPLKQHLAARPFSWDEFVDVAWQVSSAVQHAHNSGIAHGSLTADYVLVDDALKITVFGFGLTGWISHAQEETPQALPDLIHGDVKALGQLLEELIQQLPESETNIRPTHIDDIQQLIRQSRLDRRDVTARDFQGHLGDLLLSDSGDVIDMVDHRKGQQTSRRSIIDELFDDEESFQSFQQNSLEPPNTPDYTVAGVIIGLVLVIALLLILQ